MTENSTDWQEVAVYLGMVYFIGKFIWDIIVYFLKKKDGLTDTDHEAIHAIKISITEIRESQKTMLSEIVSIKTSVENIDGRVDSEEEDTRNIQEAIRVVEIFHDKNHKEKMGLTEIMNRKKKKQ